MEIYILIGVYGSGKSTILKNIDDFNMDKISLDILDKDSREKEERIRIIYNLFLNFFKIHVKDELCKNEYLKNFYIQNQSLINTLSALYSIYFFKKPNDIIINNLREKILIPSILEYFIDNISSIEEKNVFVDSGAMHFLSMDRVFFEKLYKKFHKINILYINNPTQQIIFNLFRKNNGYFAFLERGFRKEIFKNIEEKFQIIMPSNLFECTSLIEANLDIRNFIEDYIKNIIILSKMRLDTYIYSIDIYKNYVNLTEVNLDLNESIISIVNKIYDIIKTIKGQKMENKLLKEKPKVIFFDLSSTILDSHKIDLECINFVLKKYGMPSWEDGTRLKKDKAKSMKENFPNFFGEEIAEQAYQKYLQLLIDNIGRMPLIPDIEATLNYCRENGIKAVIVSNRDNIFVEKFLDIFGFRKYFDSILTPEVTGYTKPHPMIINQYLLKNSLDPKTDTILFMGDAFADVRCAFKSGCIPILYTEIVRDEISPKNLERLSKINPDNPARIIGTQRQFIELLEKSKVIWDEKARTKIAYIGAGGKIGKKAIQDICNMIPANENVELVLLGSGSEDSLTRLSGFVKDVIGSLEMAGKGDNIRFVITNDYSRTNDSSIVICSAAKWSSEEEKVRFREIDPSGRNVQSLANAEMIKNIFKQLNIFCPKALALILTNQVDMMCHISRVVTNNMNIIGLSGAVDSTRLRQSIRTITGLSSSGLMIGYHNSSMTQF